MDFTYKIRMILWSASGLVLAGILYMGIVPGGRITYSSGSEDDSFFIGRSTPEERTGESREGRMITGDPVYFSLRTPRKFDKAKLIVAYENRSPSPIIEAGVLVDKTVWNYDLEPLENRMLDALMEDWPATSGSEGLVLLERDRRFGDVDAFLKDLPPADETAAYNYDLKTGKKLPDYSPADAERVSDIPLRGPFQFYTYIKDEKLDFRFLIEDLNKNRDPDPVDVNLYRDSRPVASRHLDDDGIAADSGETGPAREIGLTMPDLPEGVYKIELKSGSDTIVRKILTKQQKLSFINKIWLADGNNKDIRLFTDAKEIFAETVNPDRLQTIDINGRSLEVSETYKQFGAKTDGKLNAVRLEKDGIILAGDGVFGFAKEAMLGSGVKKFNKNTDINADGINYILAKYDPPRQDGNVRTAAAAFDLSKAYRENGKYSFLISIPGLGAGSDPLRRSSSEADPGAVLIREIKVELEGKSLFEYLADRLKQIRLRIR